MPSSGMKSIEHSCTFNNNKKDLCVKLCLHLHLCTTFVPHTHRGQKRPSDLLELELVVVVSHYVGGKLNLSPPEEQQVLAVESQPWTLDLTVTYLKSSLNSHFPS